MAGWRFLVDENLHPPIVTYLEKERIDAAYVPDALFPGADDEGDVLPFARETDAIVVTNDVRHFSDRDEADHEGIVLVYDGTLGSLDVVSGLLDIVDAYRERDALRGYEVLDGWL